MTSSTDRIQIVQLGCWLCPTREQRLPSALYHFVCMCEWPFHEQHYTATKLAIWWTPHSDTHTYNHTNTFISTNNVNRAGSGRGGRTRGAMEGASEWSQKRNPHRIRTIWKPVKHVHSNKSWFLIIKAKVRPRTLSQSPDVRANIRTFAKCYTQYVPARRSIHTHIRIRAGTCTGT